MTVRSKALVLGTLAAASLAAAVQAQVARPADASALALPAAATAAAPPASRTTYSGTVRTAVRLTDPPLIVAVGANARKTGGGMTLAQRQAHMAMLKGKQDALMAQIGALGGREVARVGKAYNALVVDVDASKLPAIARLANVAALRELPDLQRNLTSTVPYIGAAALHSAGFTGTGIRVAILDSGIDYTHVAFGGSGSPADFAAASANATVIPPGGLFPSAKVIGGYDFVGENWPNTALAPDPNPIDAGSDAGHGTHVADIVAGVNGVAPGAKLYAVKVCSSVSTSCSGVAILAGLDWVADPNGDLDFSDAPDVINMSLGGAYGVRENPQVDALSNLVRFGIVAAVSAGNSGDRPYILGGPSNAPEAISVAQTALPNAIGYPLVVNSPPAIAGSYRNTNTVSWAPVGAGFSGLLRRGTGTAQLEACTLANTIDFTGVVAYLDRGNCGISVKVYNATAKGAIGVIVGNNAAGDAPTFSFDAANTPPGPLAPTLVVTQATGTTLKSVASNAASVSVGATSQPLGGSMASTSSRGPAYNFSAIKPEIGAPGESTSADYGSGSGTSAFGGTSGAAPMVAGSAALLLQRFPGATPPEIKARLMNSAERTVYTNPLLLPGELAPISRIGAGEARVNGAAALTTGIWDASNPYSVGLAFGALRATGVTTLQRKVAVRNYSNAARTYTITRSFRYASDQASGAVTLSAPATISVPANGTAAFSLTMTVNANLLPPWNLGAASNQGTGSLLQGVEFDGYVTVSDATDSASVPWHVLPHKAANNSPSTLGVSTGGNYSIGNAGGATAAVTEIFALTGTSPQISPNQAPYGGGEVLVDLKSVGVRPAASGGTQLLQFAVTTYGERAHPAYPAEFDIYVDSNNDGEWDYVIYTAEVGNFGTSGQTAVFYQSLSAASASASFYVDADLNSSNVIMTVPAAGVGITSPTQKFNFAVYAYDNRISGNLTDSTGVMTFTPGLPRFAPLGTTSPIAVGGTFGPVGVSAPAGGAAASPSQTGFLLLHRDARSKRESDEIVVTP